MSVRANASPKTIDIMKYCAQQSWVSVPFTSLHCDRRFASSERSDCKTMKKAIHESIGQATRKKIEELLVKSYNFADKMCVWAIIYCRSQDHPNKANKYLTPVMYTCLLWLDSVLSTTQWHSMLTTVSLSRLPLRLFQTDSHCSLLITITVFVFKSQARSTSQCSILE